MIAVQNEIIGYQSQFFLWHARSQQSSQLVQDSQARLAGYRDRLIELATDQKYKGTDRAAFVKRFRRENHILGNLLATEQYCRNMADYNRRIVDYLEFIG